MSGPARTGYLGLGSNVGDRVANLRAAIAGLGGRGVEVEAVSSGYETEPVGEILDQPDFLNLAIRIRTDLGPEELLDACKAVEADAGRDFSAPRHSPRPVDVDLLLLGDLEYETERLRLPHREVTSRRFVLVPLLELDPDLTLPDGTVLRGCLDALGDGERVEPFGPIELRR
ncbi:MAG: 2-amino-4-hydroxy-6-hydroxymethyldihydropteridine diphosphokinase [Solirubrobacterales bacterium]